MAQRLRMEQDSFPKSSTNSPTAAASIKASPASGATTTTTPASWLLLTKPFVLPRLAAEKRPDHRRLPHPTPTPGRAPASGATTRAPVPTTKRGQKPDPTTVLDAPSHKPKFTGNEPAAKAILLEPRSVKKQIAIIFSDVPNSLTSDD